MSSLELCKESWLQSYLNDSRLIQNRAMLHKCGPSCYKYSKDGTRMCRHRFYHLTSFYIQVAHTSTMESADSSAANRALDAAPTAISRAHQ